MTLNALTYALAQLGTAAPSNELLEQTVRRFPQFSRELTDRAVELWVEALAGPLPEPLSDLDFEGVVDRAMSQFHSRLAEVKAERAQREREKAAETMDRR